MRVRVAEIGGTGTVTAQRIPRLLYAADIAVLMRWGSDRAAVQCARRWMLRNGLVDRDGQRYVTTRARPRDAFPPAYLDAVDDLAPE